MLLILKNLLFTVLVPGTVFGWGPYWVLTAGGRSMPRTGGWQLVPAALIGVLGLAIYGWCLWDFAIVGRATPFPLDPPRQLVVRGLYRYVRNPMYIGVFSVILGWAIAFRSLAVAEYAVAVAAAFHIVVLAVEEPFLRTKFGTAYDEYCRHVPRWLPGRAWPAT